MGRLREKLARVGLTIDGESVPLTVSIGLVSFNGGDETQESLLKRVDELLYQAKAGGRNLLATEPQPDEVAAELSAN
jgi:two-component system cell cycle response regulator